MSLASLWAVAVMALGAPRALSERCSAEATTAPEPPKQSPEDGEDEQPTTHATANASREPHTNQHSDCGHDQIAVPDAVATSLCTERGTRFSRGKRQAIEDENTHPIVLKNRDRGYKYEL